MDSSRNDDEYKTFQIPFDREAFLSKRKTDYQADCFRQVQIRNFGQYRNFCLELKTETQF